MIKKTRKIILLDIVVLIRISNNFIGVAWNKNYFPKGKKGKFCMKK